MIACVIQFHFRFKSTYDVVTENHDVFVWGYGILGKGPNLDQSSEPVLLPAPLFGRNEFNPDTVVVAVNCGLGSNAAINSSGDLVLR